MARFDQGLLGHMLNDAIADLGQPQIGWQVGLLLACLGLAWLGARRVRQWLMSRADAAGEAHLLARRYAALSLARAMFPLLGWLIVYLTQRALVLSESELHTNMLQLALVPLFGLAGLYLAFFLLRSVFRVNGDAIASMRLFEKLLTALAWIAMVLYVLGLLPDLLASLEHIEFHFGRMRLSVLEIVSASAWILVTVLVALSLASWVENRLDRTDGMNANLKIVLARVARALLVLAALLISLSAVGIDLTVLSVFSGAIGVGIGFGLQKIASNYVAGFILLLDNSLRIGDLITVDKLYGTVTQIRTRYTLLRAADGTEALIPNENLISSVVQNHAFSEPNVRVATQVQAAYRHDPEQVMQVLVDAVRVLPRVLADPGPAAIMLNFADSGITYEVGCWIGDPENGRLSVQSAMNMSIWKAFQAQGIEIPYPQRELRLLDNTPGDPVAEIRQKT